MQFAACGSNCSLARGTFATALCCQIVFKNQFAAGNLNSIVDVLGICIAYVCIFCDDQRSADNLQSRATGSIQYIPIHLQCNRLARVVEANTAYGNSCSFSAFGGIQLCILRLAVRNCIQGFRHRSIEIALAVHGYRCKAAGRACACCRIPNMVCLPCAVRSIATHLAFGNVLFAVFCRQCIHRVRARTKLIPALAELIMFIFILRFVTCVRFTILILAIATAFAGLSMTSCAIRHILEIAFIHIILMAVITILKNKIGERQTKSTTPLLVCQFIVVGRGFYIPHVVAQTNIYRSLSGCTVRLQPATENTKSTPSFISGECCFVTVSLNNQTAPIFVIFARRVDFASINIDIH